MIHKGSRLLLTALVGTMVAMPVKAGCWSDAAAEATQVRILQTRLMVATLKCQTAGVDITATYNDFIRAKRQVLAGANARIKAHFTDDAATARAADAGQAYYDRFVTSLANAFGAEETNAETCAAAATLAMDAAAETADLQQLSAAQAGIATPASVRRLGGELCAAAAAPVQLAAVTPVPTASAPPPPAAVTASAAPKPPLPPEVVAAMAVIAAFARDQGTSPTIAAATTAAAPTAPAPITTAMIGTP
jgi:hypothetical protein